MLAPVEALERRLYLGGMVSSAIAGVGDANVNDALADVPHELTQAAGKNESANERVELPPVQDESASGTSGAADRLSTHVMPTADLLGPVLASAWNDTTTDTTVAANASADIEQSLFSLAIELAPTHDPTPSDSASGETTFMADDLASQSTEAAAATQAFHAENDVSAAATQVSGSALQQQAMTNEEAQLEAAEVATLLDRASAATASEDAIIAVVDRNGRILGVRVEQAILDRGLSQAELVFMIDGAVAKARTAALFSNGELGGSAAPLTSRTVRFISQSTNTQREVESNPNVDGTSLAEANASTVRGPGFVAPIGVGGHFPPEIINTPPVDLFAIEHTNRDSNLHPGTDGIRGTADDFLLRTSPDDADGETVGRFNLDPNFVPTGQGLYAPESYGSVDNSDWLRDAQSRGIATLPGGIPLFRDSDFDGFGDTLVGGIGVFFPGEDGFATHEQGFVAGIGQTEAERTNAPLVLEAEFIALAAAGGSLGAEAWIPGAKVGDLAGIPPVEGLDLPFGRLDLVGITLEGIGPGSSKTGIPTVLQRGAEVGPGAVNGMNMPLANSVDGFLRNGKIVAAGWLVTPHDSMVDNITATDVETIIENAIAAANETRAAVRLPIGSRTRMVFAIADSSGEILGLYRMENATTFSIDVAVAKARNVGYYADSADLQAVDQVVAAGTAFTNRTFRFLAEPRYPSGIDGPPPEFSILNDDNINPRTAENLGGPATVSELDSVKGHDAFFPMTNFRDPGDATVVAAMGPQPLANQNGIVFFPGSTPLYKDGVLIGGFGVSGDGVDQDDVVTFLGAQGYLPDATVTRADQVFLNGVRLPFQKFLRNPFG